ncbi:MAG: hypothetical protein M3Y42_11915 [Actinomycetota bacterium]|nr:hypothetical protein [Actinomycetota bacterium]MDQ2957659.1 hypothetical protein [Actinomycetota bacterium]
MDKEEPTNERAFSTSGDTPLDGTPQVVPPLAEPIPGTLIDEAEGRDPSPG